MTMSQQIMLMEYRVDCLRQAQKMIDTLVRKAYKLDRIANTSVQDTIEVEMWDYIQDAFHEVLNSYR